MKRNLLLTVVVLLVLVSTAFAQTPTVGDKSLIDTKYDKAIVVNLDEWFANHPLKAGDNTRSDVIFQSPRDMVVAVTNKGPLIGLHYHTSADEIVIVHTGQGEMFINGEWVPVKAGDLHVNPRGVIHGTRTVGDGELQVVSIFTPLQAKGNDKVMTENASEYIGDGGLLDTVYMQSILVRLPEWFAAHPIPEGKTVQGDMVYASPRSVVGLTSLIGVPVGSHHHFSCEEIVYVLEGEGQMLINGNWVPVKAGDLHVNPRGIIHGTNADKGQLKVVGIFAPPQAKGDDKIIVK